MLGGLGWGEQLKIIINLYRGWIHIEILPEHNASIRRTFRSDGPFLKALIQLAKYPEYSYDMVPEAFSVINI